MAKRRMFDRDFMLSDWFMSLHWAAQLLYTRLLLSADDDGFVSNAQTQQRMIGIRYHPLKVLEDTKLIHTFDSGVTLLLHWNVHNCVRKSTYTPTRYTAEKALVILEKNKIYRLKNDTELSQNCDQNASQERKDKERKDQYSTDKKKAAQGANASGGVCKKNNFEIFWDAYPKKTDRPATEKQFKNIDVPLETLLNALEAQKKSHQWTASNGIYIPNPATWLKNRRWEDRLPQPIPYGASGQPGEVELSYIRNALAQSI